MHSGSDQHMSDRAFIFDMVLIVGYASLSFVALRAFGGWSPWATKRGFQWRMAAVALGGVAVLVIRHGSETL